MGENYFGITDPGRMRTNNEDRFIAAADLNGRFIIASVIDGVGGYSGGEVAAQITRDEIINSLDKMSGNIIDQLVTAFRHANEKINREKEINPQNNQMACVATLAVVDIEKNVFYFAHIGDTRLYLFRDGSLIKITTDHSVVGFLEESGRLTEEAAMMHPRRNEVNKALGFETNLPLAKDFIDTGESPFLPGDTILLCSDGLTDMITSHQVISILNREDDLPAKGRLLVNAANEAGGKDNITVALVQNDKSPVQHAATKPLIILKNNNTSYESEPGTAGKNASANKAGIQKSSGKNINGILLFFCIVFLLGFVWLWYKNYQTEEADKTLEKPLQNQVLKPANKPELDFLDSVHVASNAITRLTGGQTIVVTDSILIKNDSLHLIGNGATFIRDTAYTGPGFTLAPDCKYILLDSLTIENFNVGILVLGKGLHLKNVRFKNCLVPLQFQQQFSKDTLVSGKQAETVFFYTDSVRR